MGRKRLQQQGDLYQQGGWWKLRWRVDRIKADGTQDRGWSRPVIVGPAAGNAASLKPITEKEARRQAWNNFLSRLDENTRTPQCIVTVEQFWERKFQPERVTNMRPKTRQHYDVFWRNHVKPAIGGLQLCEVSSDEIQQMCSRILNSSWMPTLPKDPKKAALVKPRAYSVRTATAAKIVVQAMFKHAKRKGWFNGDNPADAVELPEMRRPERHALDFDGCRRVLAALKSPVREMAYTLIILSLNVAELLGLAWKRCNLTDAWGQADGEALPPWSVAIRQQWELGQYGPVKRDSRERIIQIPPALRPVFLALRKREHWTGPNDPVFASRTGKPLDAHNYANRDLKTAGKALDMPWLSWHVFRHTHATLTKIVGREVGLSDDDRRRLMGHSQLSMTDRYTHAEMDRQAAALELIASRLMGEPQGGVQ